MARSWAASVARNLVSSVSERLREVKSTPALTNSGALPHSEGASAAELAGIISALTLLIAICGWWVHRMDYVLYYGDAQAHLNISRSIIDSKTPGYDQFGTVWLP